MPKTITPQVAATASLSRRSLLKQSALAIGAGLAGTTAAQAKVAPSDNPFDYEVTHTDAEWQEMLGDAYPIMREGETEQPFTHPYWQLNEPGHFHCKGCDLLAYSSERKYFPDKGWVFFTAGEPNAHLFAIDLHSEMAQAVEDPMNTEEAPARNEIASNFFMEAHCRRCGSHHGHIVSIDAEVLHCINGLSLVFKPLEA